MKKDSRGFIALMSVLIISSVLLVTVLSLAQYGIANRYSLLALEQKTESKWLAEACIEWVRIEIAKEPALVIVTPPEERPPVDVGGGKTCSIQSVVPDSTGGFSNVLVWGASDKAVTNLSARIDSDDASLLTLKEIPKIPLIP